MGKEKMEWLEKNVLEQFVPSVTIVMIQRGHPVGQKCN